MRSLKFIYYSISCLLLISSVYSFGSEPVKDTLSPVPLQIDKQTEEDVFSNDAYEMKTEVKKDDGEGFWDWLMHKIFGKKGDKIVWDIVLVVLAIVFIGGIVLIVRKMNGGKLFRSESSRTSVFTDIQEDIDSIDIDKRIKDALDEGDYKLAFRYSYLKSLQLMNNKELIEWKPYKTNYEYYMEFKKLQMKPLYKDLYTGFEYVWYGDAPLSKEVFEKYEVEFNNFNQQLSV